MRLTDGSRKESIGVSQFREIRFKPYRIFYSIEQAAVTIQCVPDGRRVDDRTI
jgi:hypothetical protein